MKFLIFDTTARFLTKRQTPPFTRTSSSSSSHSTTSTLSTIVSEDDDDRLTDGSDTYHKSSCLTLQEDDKMSLKKKVRFTKPCQNQLYDNQVMTRDQVDDLWYTADDFHAFKRDMMQEAHAIVKAEKKALANACSAADDDENTTNNTNTNDGMSVITALGKAYNGFCHVESPADIFAVLAVAKLPNLHDNHVKYIGLDRYIIREIVLDRTERKRRLQCQMEWWQRNCKGIKHSDVLATKLRDISRLESQPSRLYAQHVAHAARGIPRG